ncbi:MAG: 1-deoxy-D-xylulose-5-phosphate synthase [Erysipelotrichales bacterium]|nr:1-deoxy-D-xylulose-5-phosphate synthase [Erysipelotrichales bacterium]
MKITDIKDPSFLKDLSVEQLEELSDDIRRFLIESVSKTGGHLASNLGVVELTVALHKAFDSPKDKIFFDVGHQCYVHKILTGRAKDFSSLRQYKGISGFQKRSESEHDVWEAGHSSTSLSAALGMAVARDLNHEDYQIIPVIGDGALESGMSLEALNEIGDENRRMIIIFNDNHMSISENVGFLSKSFARLRISPLYTALKQDLKSGLKKTQFGKTLFSRLANMKGTIRDMVVNGGIFEEFGLDYLGPIDGHNMKDLLKALGTAKEKAQDHTVVVHVCTEKGKGYKPCENDQTGKWHGVGPFDIKTGKPLKVQNPDETSWSAVMADHLSDLARKNRDIVCLTPAMKVGSKLENFFREFPDRSFDTGIAEEHAATMAAGLAVSGKRPYLCVYSTFLQRAYDQLNHDICRMDLPVVIGIDRAGIVGHDGATHHGVFDIGMLRALPHMIIAEGKDADEAQKLLNTAFAQKHPFAVRYPRGNTRKPADVTDETTVPVGSWEVFGEISKDIPVICTYGPNVRRVQKLLEEHGIRADVVNCRFFKPLDEEVMETLCRIQPELIVYETDMKAEGLGSAMMEWANDHGYTLMMKDTGIGDHYVTHGDQASVEKEEGLDPEALLKFLM